MVRLLILLAMLVCLTGTAHAWFTFDWTLGNPHVVFMPDPDDAGGAGGYDILDGIWWGMEGNYQYFRMDLAAQPTAGTDQGDTYGFYIDAIPSHGATAPLPAWIPPEMAGNDIDYVVMNSFITGFGTGYQLSWNGSSWQTVLAGNQFKSSVDPVTGHYILEWRVPAANLPMNFRFWGGIIDQYPGPPFSLDVTDRALTPEPTTLALIGMGIGGLYLRRRRRKD